MDLQPTISRARSCMYSLDSRKFMVDREAIGMLTAGQ